MKYRLIAGTINRYADEEGWENIHLDISPRGIWHHDLRMAVLPEVVGDVTSMAEFRRGMFDEVRMHHVLEHLTWDQAELAVNATARILKPNGIFDVEVPDMDRIAQAWVDGEHTKTGLQQWIYGEQLPNHEAGDSHRYAFCEESLRELLAPHFAVGDREETGLAVRLIATKREPKEEE